MAGVPASKRNAISHVSIVGLHGRYSYELPSPPLKRNDPHDRVLILYGDNGSGKTSLLELLFHLLSAANNRGHRHYLAKTRFERIAIRLADGTEIVAHREDPEHSSYALSLIGRGIDCRAMVVVNRSQVIVDSPEHDAELVEFTSALRHLDLTPFYISDERDVTSDAIEPEPYFEDYGATAEERHFYTASLRLHESPPSAGPKRTRQALELEDALRRATTWIRVSSAQATTAGDANSNTVYTQLLRQIADTDIRKNSTSDVAALVDRLSALAARARRYTPYGLHSPIPARELTRILEEAPRSTHSMLSQVLEPYLDGIEARLDALSRVQRVVETFVTTLDAFYRHKHVTFSVRDGLRVVSDSGDEISPSTLSSGERQLLLLFCHLVHARNTPSLFIIDEPEISLNVKWQRTLVDGLLRCTEGSPVRFLLATHSIELLTPYRERALHLRAD